MHFEATTRLLALDATQHGPDQVPQVVQKGVLLHFRRIGGCPNHCVVHTTRRIADQLVDVLCCVVHHFESLHFERPLHKVVDKFEINGIRVHSGQSLRYQSQISIAVVVVLGKIGCGQYTYKISNRKLRVALCLLLQHGVYNLFQLSNAHGVALELPNHGHNLQCQALDAFRVVNEVLDGTAAQTDPVQRFDPLHRWSKLWSHIIEPYVYVMVRQKSPYECRPKKKWK